MQAFFSIATKRVLTLAAPAHAAEPWGDCVVNDVATIQCLEPMFENLVRAILSLAGVALFIMLVVGGFGYLTSSGDPKKLEQAKQTITYAAIGIVLMAAAFLILRTIAYFTGVDVLIFEIPDYVP